MGTSSSPNQASTSLTPALVRQELQTWWAGAAPIMRVYFAGMICGLVALPVGWVTGFNPITHGLLFTAAFLLAGGLLTEAYAVAYRL